jgi:hypothetical protein
MKGKVGRLGLRRKGWGRAYLRANESTNSLLGGANGLIPRTLGAVWVVLGDGTGRRSRVIANLGCCMGSLVLEFSLRLLGFASVLLFD